MSRFLSFLILFASGVAVAEEPVWATAVSSNGERKIVYRYLETPPTKDEKHRKPIRVILKWPYNSETGMPDQQETDGMMEMEDALEAGLEGTGTASLTLVSTGEGFREWIYYAVSEDQFLAGVNAALAGKPRFPIEIHIAEDPEWSVYENFANGVLEPN